MRRVGSRNTSPEIALRKALWSRGFRYRLHANKLPGKPDFVLPSHRVAVFVDGDFWHGNQWRLRGLSSLDQQFENSATSSYWIPKIRRNMERDLANNQILRQMGWRVVRCWESEIKREPDRCVEKIIQQIRR